MYLLPVTFLAPLFGFLFLLITSLRKTSISNNRIFAVSFGGFLLSLLSALISTISYMTSHVITSKDSLDITSVEVINVTLLSWLRIGEFSPIFGLLFDGLSMSMLLIVIIIGLIVHVFAVWKINVFDKGQHSQESNNHNIATFFAYLNLLISGMILLILADNLLLLYFGWEIVGVCVYLLINSRTVFITEQFIKNNLVQGNVYTPTQLKQVATKTFLMNRIGDVALIVGLLLLLKGFDSTNIHNILTTAVHSANDSSASNNPNLSITMFLLALAAVSRSAQIPMHSWLEGASSWVSPVSALIQTVIMVSSGVYLLARFHPMFLLTPGVLFWSIAIIGGVTMILCAIFAIIETDIKRIIAYSTMSQLGFIFLVMGVGAWQAGLYHLITHAIYKSLLVLACGALLIGVNYQQNIFKLGGLREKMPLIFWSFMFGCGSLMALPLTVGFDSVNLMLQALKLSHYQFLYLTAIFGLFLTSIYSVRLLLCLFFGNEQTKADYLEGSLYQKPILILLIFSTIIGAVVLRWFLTPLSFDLPASQAVAWVNIGLDTHTTQLLASISGMAVAWIMYKKNE